MRHLRGHQERQLGSYLGTGEGRGVKVSDAISGLNNGALSAGLTFMHFLGRVPPPPSSAYKPTAPVSHSVFPGKNQFTMSAGSQLLRAELLVQIISLKVGYELKIAAKYISHQTRFQTRITRGGGGDQPFMFLFLVSNAAVEISFCRSRIILFFLVRFSSQIPFPTELLM